MSGIMHGKFECRQTDLEVLLCMCRYSILSDKVSVGSLGLRAEKVTSMMVAQV